MRRHLTLALMLLAVLAAWIPNLAHAEGPDLYVTVKPGDTLYAIATRYGVSMSALLAANHLPLAEFVYVGQRLVIPGHALRKANAQTSSASGEYIVRAGDTLYSIAVKHNSTVAAFVRANNLASVYVYTGQRLRVPNASIASNSAPSRSAPLPAASIASNSAPSPSVPVPAAPASPPPSVRFDDPNGAPLPLAPVVPNPPTTERWIDVDVTNQTVTAYEGATPIKTVRTSTGLPRTPTVLGTFQIYRKLATKTMAGGSKAAGDYYYLPDVPDVMYFYKSYALHGTYWHSNFGRPMSHGCVNLTLADAKWFYEFASVGTLVVAHK